MRSFRRLFAIVLAAPLLWGVSTPAGAQSARPALLQSGDRLFVLGFPRAVGALPGIYGVRWRRDSGAFSFFGQVSAATPRRERNALIRGENPPLEETGLFIYDVENARLRAVGKFKVARDNEYFLEAFWIGQDLYVRTGTLATPQAPEMSARLYCYSPRTGQTTLLEEGGAAAQWEESPTGAPFLIKRFFGGKEGKEFRLSVIADGKVFPVPLEAGYEGLGVSGWSADGAQYYKERNFDSKETGKGANDVVAIRYEAGTVQITKVALNREKDLFVLQKPEEPTLRPDREQRLGRPYLVTLQGKARLGPSASTLPPDEPSTPIPDRYDVALSTADDGKSCWLAPNNGVVVFIAQDTLFVQTIVEARGGEQEIILRPIEEEQLRRICTQVKTEKDRYETLQRNQTANKPILTPANSREILAPSLSDEETQRRFQWKGRDGIIGEAIGKRLRATLTMKGDILISDR